ncbi:hypothetical protein Pcac1_g29492 [Phytophthora cactorum]|nr:hypothetical protein Pcac1_g29492 [Phytophthora cactorum]
MSTSRDKREDGDGEDGERGQGVQQPTESLASAHTAGNWAHGGQVLDQAEGRESGPKTRRQWQWQWQRPWTRGPKQHPVEKTTATGYGLRLRSSGVRGFPGMWNFDGQEYVRDVGGRQRGATHHICNDKAKFAI